MRLVRKMPQPLTENIIQESTCAIMTTGLQEERVCRRSKELFQMELSRHGGSG